MATANMVLAIIILSAWAIGAATSWLAIIAFRQIFRPVLREALKHNPEWVFEVREELGDSE